MPKDLRDRREQQRDHQKNREKFCERMREYYKKNREKLCEQKREYAQKNQEKLREYRQKNREKKREYNREYRKNNLEKKRERDLNRVYGMSLEVYTALVKAQSGKCAICSSPCRLFVDHDHATGRVRGLLCRGCNSGLGFFKDSKEALVRAINYLTNKET